MTKSYTPGSEADDIIARQLAKGHFATADDVVRAGVKMLDEQEQEIDYLRKLIDEGDADIAGNRVHRYADGGELAADIGKRGAARSNQKR
jgi:antitoxin ParD1/3/4